MAPTSRFASTSVLAAAISLALIQQTAAQDASTSTAAGSAAGYGLDANGLTMDPQQADRLQRRTVSNIPFQYTGSNARISVGVDDELQLTGEGLGIFGFDGTRATLLEGWLGRHGAGGVKLGYHWLWGNATREWLWGNATREDTLGAASDVWVAKVFGAVDRNEFHDRKATIGAGVERNNRFLDLYYEHALSDPRRTASTSESVTGTVYGEDPDGRPWQQANTATTLVESFAVPYEHGVGFRLGRYFEYPMLRLRGGLDYAWGDDLLQDDHARQLGATVSLEKFIENSGHSLALDLGYTRKNGPFDSGRFGNEDEDLRVALQWRYEFGQAHRRTDASETPESDRPAPWVERALRNLPQHRRQVDTYAAQRKTITVTEGEKIYLNRAPIAGEAENFTVVSGVALTGNVLGNDSDPDPGDTITAVLTTNVAHGTLVLNADGSFTYTPAAGYAGPDTFTYVVRDSHGADSAPVTVTITVQAPASNSAPVATDDAFPGVFDNEVHGNVLTNDSDPDGDALHVATHDATSALGAIVVFDDSGNFTYVPQGISGTDTFTYTIADAFGATSTATVTITMAPNQPPVANNDSFQTPFQTELRANAFANDSDAEGAVLLFHHDPVSAHGGTVEFFSQGEFVYAPPANFSGTDTFTYTVNDIHDVRTTATVTITVDAPTTNLAPVANDDPVAAIVGNPIDLFVLGNDTDANPGDVLAIQSNTQPASGTLALSGDHFTYTPSEVGTFTFDYVVSDGQATDTATVTITVSPSNTNLPPVAGPAETFDAIAGVPITGDVLDEFDTDPNAGDTLHVELVTDVAHGTLQLNADGTFTYAANAAFTGPTDSFTYVVMDQDGAKSQEVTVTISVTAASVNQAPVANADAVSAVAGTMLTYDLFGNDTDENTATLILGSFDLTEGCTATPPGIASDGTLTWNVPADLSGTCNLTYTVKDEQGLESQPAAVAITVAPAGTNLPPVAGPAETFDAVAGVQITGDVLDAQDTDPNPGDILHVELVTDVAHGTLQLNQVDGTFTYTADAAFTGPTDSFTYFVVDQDGARSQEVTVTINVSAAGANLSPVAGNDSYQMFMNGQLGRVVAFNDSDPDGSIVRYSVVEQNFNAGDAFIFFEDGGDFLYTPAAGSSGTVTFKYTVTDDKGATSLPATVTIEVLPETNLAPDAVNDSAQTTMGSPVSIFVLQNDTDDHNTLIFESRTQPSSGVLEVRAGGHLVYHPQNVGTFTFTYTISDGFLFDTATVTVEVLPVSVNQQPLAVNDSFIDIPFGTTGVVGNVLGNDDDESRATLAVPTDSVTYSAECAAVLGGGSLNASGDVVINTGGTAGTCLITYRAQDGQGLSSDPATATVTVLPNAAPTAVADTFSVLFGTTGVIGNVLQNDSDEDLSTVTAVGIGGGGNCDLMALQLSPAGDISITPGNFAGTCVYSYHLEDSQGLVSSNSAPVTVEVAANQAPVAVDDGPLQITVNTPLPINKSQRSPGKRSAPGDL